MINGDREKGNRMLNDVFLLLPLVLVFGTVYLIFCALFDRAVLKNWVREEIESITGVKQE